MTFGTGTLRRGSAGDGVTELQQWLIDRGFLIAYTGPTGTFDDVTEHAVKAFQFSAGLGVDGAIGGGSRTAADGFTGTAATTGWHPTAIRNIQVDSSGGAFSTTDRRGVLHTTETSRLPGYSSPPHFTIGRDGSGQPVALWQHYPITVASKALRHPSGTVETNRLGAIQIEIITLALDSPNLAANDSGLFTALGQLMRWIEANAGIAAVANHAFDGNSAYGLSGSVRLSDADWQASTGWVGHQHVPNNTHWDPGLIDIAGLLAVPAATTAPPPAPPTSIPSLGGTTFAAANGGRPSIRATTRRLSNAFPSLTFSVDSAGSPFFEVMLTTDHTLFAPEHAGRRTPDNFYAGRRDGLRDAEMARGRYVAPVPVVRAFADANPNGGAIYYTLVAYADERGGGANPVADPIALSRSAPSVAMVPGFRAHTTTETLGVPLSMLKPVVRAAALASVGAPAVVGPARGYSGNGSNPLGNGNGANGVGGGNAADGRAGSVDPTADRAEGEDGYDFRMTTHDQVPDMPPELSPAGPSGKGGRAVPTDGEAATPGVSEGDELDEIGALEPGGVPANGGVGPSLGSPPPALPSASPGNPGPEPQKAAGYDDGWGEWAEAGALDSEFPRGQAQPPPLLGDESLYLGPENEYDDLGWAGTSYGDPPAAPDGTGEPASPPALPPDWRRPAPAMTPAQKRAVIEAFVGPDTDLYSAAGADREFAGGAGTDHPAYQRYHLGLSFGICAFSQDSGELGQLLTLMQQRDGTRFAEVFGESAVELVEVTTRPGPAAKDMPEGRSVRVRPVAGAELWEQPWLSRFVEAGGHRPFQSAQIELAAGLYLDPTVRFASDLGLATERGLAMIFDRAAHRGVQGGLNWIIETVGPLQTPVLVAEALRALGFPDLESFQRSQPDLLVDDQFGPLTHAAMTGALLSHPELAGAPPVPILSYQQMLDAIAQRSAGQPWGDRIVRINRDSTLADDLPAGEAGA